MWIRTPLNGMVNLDRADYIILATKGPKDQYAIFACYRDTSNVVDTRALTDYAEKDALTPLYDALCAQLEAG